MPQYVGSVYLDVRFDATQASQALKTEVSGAAEAGSRAMNQTMSDRLLQFGTQATRVGRQLSFGLAAPLAMLGKASEQAFVEFDTNMTKVAALSGAGAEQTEAWSQQVLDLATSYGVAGEDAANALYAITSSGIKGQAAINTLNVALKASAVGMGDAKTMAGLLTSAMNAYGPAQLSAAKAADILTGAVQESKIPADELAGSISQVLPFASKLGISFDQVAASMAATSLTGTDAAKAATQLRGIFSALLSPSAQMDKALKSIGLTSAQLRESFAGKGILGGLRDLQGAIISSGQEADTTLADMFGNVRALTGVFALLNDQGDQIDRVFQNTANSAGKLNAAYIITANTAGFKAKQATQEFHNTLIQLGQDVAPVATTFLHMASSVIGFVDAVAPLKYALIGIGAGLAILGPAAYSIGAIADVFGLAAGLAEKYGASALAANEAAAGSAQGVVAAEGEIAGTTEAATAAQGELAGATEVTAASFEQLGLFGETTMGTLVAATEAETEAMGQLALFGPTAMTGIETQAGVAAAEMTTLAGATEATAVATEGVAAAEVTTTAAAAPMGAAIMAALGPIAVALTGIVGAWAIWNERMNIAQDHADNLGDIFANKVAKGGVDDASKTIDKTINQIKDLRSEADQVKAPWDLDYKQELYKGADALEAHVNATREDIGMAKALAAQTGESVDKIFQWVSSERNAGTTYKSSKEALAAYTKAMGEHGEKVSTATTETGKLAEKADDLSSKFFGVQKAQRAYEDAVRGVGDAQRKAEDAQVALTDARRNERDAIDKVAEAQDRHRQSLVKVADAQRALSEAQASYQELLKGPTKGEQLDVRSAQLQVQQAQKRLRGKFEDPLERQQAQIDLERAQMGLQEARGAHEKNLARAHDDVTRAQDNLTSAQKDAVDAAKAIGDAQRGVETAHRQVRDAQLNVEQATRDVAKAQEDSVGAADALAGAQAGFADAIANSNTGLDPLLGYLGQLKELYPQVAGAIQPYLDQLGALETWRKKEEERRTAEKAKPPEPPPKMTKEEIEAKEAAFREWLSQGMPGDFEDYYKRKQTGRAMGGPLAAGQVSTVAELGAPELWVSGGKQYLLPPAAGYVTPLHPSIDQSVTNAPSVQVGDIYVQGADQPVQTAYEIRRQLRVKRDLVGRR